MKKFWPASVSILSGVRSPGNWAAAAVRNAAVVATTAARGTRDGPDPRIVAAGVSVFLGRERQHLPAGVREEHKPEHGYRIWPRAHRRKAGVAFAADRLAEPEHRDDDQDGDEKIGEAGTPSDGSAAGAHSRGVPPSTPSKIRRGWKSSTSDSPRLRLRRSS
jgi:hypothetical protein